MRKYRCIALLLLGLYLGVHHGRVALWDTEQSQPVEIFPYRVETYPLPDQLALEKGIPLTDQAQLQKLLEDLMS